MNKLLGNILEKFDNKFKIELERQKKFFNKPDILVSIFSYSLQLLDNLITEKKSKAEILDFVKRDKGIKKILSYTSLSFEEDILNDILLKCFSEEEITIPEFDNISPESFINYASKVNDIDSKINYKKHENFLRNLQNNVLTFSSYIFLLHYIIEITKDLFSKTEFLSIYRTKYIQTLIRNTYGILITQFKNSKNEYKAIIESLKKIDDILIAATLASYIYKNNRSKLQKISREKLHEISKDITCNDFEDPSDIVINTTSLNNINLNCPIETDDEIIPHTPIEEKLKIISCEVPQNKEPVIKSNLSPDLITTAIIENRTNNKFEIKVNKDSHITENTLIAIYDNKEIYSPVNGYIDYTDKNKIIIRDVENFDQSLLASQIELLNKKYERLNYIKSFLKDFYIISIYPVMLSTSILDDTSTNISNINIKIGVEDEWKKYKKRYENINEKFNDKIKKITSKDNIEKHANNETLYEIKETIEKEENAFYKEINSLGKTAINVSKIIRAKDKEFELIDYYLFKLGDPLNSIENPNEIELIFKDKINEFINERLVISDYKKQKLSEKINDQIKDIEKGASPGNWFDKLIKIYNSKKSIDDVKKWLSGIAQKNKKLNDAERKQSINSILFLFNLYLQYDDIVKKYNVIIKEKNKKKKTIEEGLWIKRFFDDIWNEYNNIFKEINKIENLIESLKLFQAYSIIEYNGKLSRLYLINDNTKCEIKDDDFKPSKFGYGDIEYWLKYCSYATLASITNPVTGWSTGWVFPTPILFPVIYIPVKAISTTYGFIVIGISICGIWIYPWVLMANLSGNYVIPFGDPTISIKKEIEQTKKSLSENVFNLRKNIIKKLMDEQKEKIIQKEEEIKGIKKSLVDHQNLKPSKYLNNIKKPTLEYLKEIEKWEEGKIIIQDKLTKAKYDKWLLTQKWKLLSDAYKMKKGVKGIDDKIEKIEESINNQFNKLDKLIDKLNNVIAPLPITMKPYSINFGITLKNTKPIIKITDDINENINEDKLINIFEKNRLTEKDLMLSNFDNKISSSILNLKQFKSIIFGQRNILISNDPFPKYEELKPSNVQWMKFLYKDFIKVGAQTYGFPGQAPLPI